MTLTAPTRVAGRLTRSAAFALNAAILATFFAAASAPTPLYGLYQRRWHFSTGMLTVVFAAYALAVLAALLTVGSLSDHIGRRPVLLATLVAEAVALALFVGAGGLGGLLIARVVQGLATGAATGVLGAALLDLERRDAPGRGALINSVAPMIGLAAGGIGCSCLLDWAPGPTRTVYLLLLAVVVLEALGVLLAPETSSRRDGALHSLRPRVGLPAAARRTVLIAAPAIVACWALGGLYLSLGPTVARVVTGWQSPLLGGLLVLILAGGGALAILALRRSSGQLTMLIGTASLVTGMAITLVAVSAADRWIFFAGTLVAGAGFGSAFSGAMRVVLPTAAPHERAELLAGCYVLSYLAFSGPAVLAGLLAPRFGLLTTLRGYAAVVLVLAATAGLSLLRQRRAVVAR